MFALPRQIALETLALDIFPRFCATSKGELLAQQRPELLEGTVAPRGGNGNGRSRAVSQELEDKASTVPRAPTWAMDPKLDGLLKVLSDETHPLMQSEKGVTQVYERIRKHVQQAKKRRVSNRKLKALFNAARRTPAFMAEVVEVRSKSGRNVMRTLSLLERQLVPGSRLAKGVAAIRQSLHDASHYGQSRFRSQLIAICFILTGQMHAIAAFTSSGGEGRRVSYDPAISYFEMKITEFFKPIQARTHVYPHR